MRSGEDVKKKWTCMSSESKKKLALNKREQKQNWRGGGIDVLDEATSSASSPKSTDVPSVMESTDNDEEVTLTKGVEKKRKRVDIGYENSTCTLVEIEQ
uniref:Uncharacterized protein n=1 Tax=Magallana gigas TaxID=29159 RepID=A0A8W8N0E4_MAGGI